MKPKMKSLAKRSISFRSLGIVVAGRRAIEQPGQGRRGLDSIQNPRAIGFSPRACAKLSTGIAVIQRSTVHNTLAQVLFLGGRLQALQAF